MINPYQPRDDRRRLRAFKIDRYFLMNFAIGFIVGLGLFLAALLTLFFYLIATPG